MQRREGCCLRKWTVKVWSPQQSLLARNLLSFKWVLRLAVLDSLHSHLKHWHLPPITAHACTHTDWWCHLTSKRKHHIPAEERYNQSAFVHTHNQTLDVLEFNHLLISQCLGQPIVRILCLDLTMSLSATYWKNPYFLSVSLMYHYQTVLKQQK